MTGDSQETCWTVVHAAANGDNDARATFSRNYSAAIRGFLEARWRGRRFATELDDAVQEVFVECLKPGGILERARPENGDFRGLLFAATRNVARRFEERAVRRGCVPPEDSAWLERIADDEPGQATLFDRSWARTLVRQASARHRERALAEGDSGRRRIQLLERRFGNDEAIRTIAAERGVPAQEVHNAYRKARREFYLCLREVVAFHRPAATDLDLECRELLALL